MISGFPEGPGSSGCCGARTQSRVCRQQVTIVTELAENEACAGVFPIAPTPFTEAGALRRSGIPSNH